MRNFVTAAVAVFAISLMACGEKDDDTAEEAEVEETAEEEAESGETGEAEEGDTGSEETK